MIEAAVTPADAQQFRILIKSVGTARPSASAAVAKGLGLPASTVIARLYRAPAVLVDGIDEPVAERMAGFLGEIGYEAEVQGMSEPAPVPAPLNDVAVYIEDARQFQQVVEKLASFLGVAEPDASRHRRVSCLARSVMRRSMHFQSIWARGFPSCRHSLIKLATTCLSALKKAWFKTAYWPIWPVPAWSFVVMMV